MKLKHQNNNSFKEKAKAFFHGQTWEKALTFLFFLFLAFGFWLLQYLQQKFEMSFVIPIHYKNIPVNVILKEPIPNEINFKVEDKGTVLLNYYAGKKYSPLEIDLKDIQSSENTFNISQSTLKTEIFKRLAASTSLLNFSPEILSINYTLLQNKKVPIVLNGIMKPASGYLIDTVIQDISTLTISGDKDILNKIDTIYTEKIEVVNINDSITKAVKLLSPDSRVTLEVNFINIYIRARESVEKRFSLWIACLNMPSGYSVKLSPAKVEMVCRKFVDDHFEINEHDLEVAVEYTDLTKSQNSRVPVRVIKKPDWLKNYQLFPEEVEFSIEKKTD